MTLPRQHHWDLLPQFVHLYDEQESEQLAAGSDSLPTGLHGHPQSLLLQDEVVPGVTGRVWAAGAAGVASVVGDWVCPVLVTACSRCLHNRKARCMMHQN